MAATLPKDKYKCDFSTKKIIEKPVIPVELKTAACNTYGEKDTCDDNGCSWCTAPASGG
jgi:hypothetical protein